MHQPNWFHRIGFAVWAVVLVGGLVVRPGPGWLATALEAAPLAFFALVGAAVLLAEPRQR